MTSLWGDFPADASEAFADALDDLDSEAVNNFCDRILEETEVTVSQTLIIDGVTHTYTHHAKWDDVLMIPGLSKNSENEPAETETAQVETNQGGSLKFASNETLQNDSPIPPIIKPVTELTPFRTPPVSPGAIPLPESDSDLWSNKSDSDRSSGSSLDENEEEFSPRAKSKRSNLEFRNLLRSLDSEFTNDSIRSNESSRTVSPLPAPPDPPPELQSERNLQCLSDSLSDCSSTSTTSNDELTPPFLPPLSHIRQNSNLSSSDIDLLSDVEVRVKKILNKRIMS